MKRAFVVVMFALPLAMFSLPPSVASASRMAQENLTGVETGIPQSSSRCPAGSSVVLSPFAGTTTGSIGGTWSAGACHGDLPGAVGKSIPLLSGGYLTVRGFTSSGRYASLSGGFGPGHGTITWVSTSGDPSGFNTQVYTVSGPLTGGNIQSGHMSVTLRHYRFRSTTLEATVTGSATFRY